MHGGDAANAQARRRRNCRRPPPLTAGLIAAFTGAAGAGEPIPADHFVVPEGFEVQVWAQSPQLRNPTNIDIDHKGRVWVAEGVNYRTHAGRDEDGDRVVVLEDTDGDGRADRSTVFVQDETIIIDTAMPAASWR